MLFKILFYLFQWNLFLIKNLNDALKVLDETKADKDWAKAEFEKVIFSVLTKRALIETWKAEFALKIFLFASLKNRKRTEEI